MTPRWDQAGLDNGKNGGWLVGSKHAKHTAYYPNACSIMHVLLLCWMHGCARILALGCNRLICGACGRCNTSAFCWPAEHPPQEREGAILTMP